MGFYKTTGVTQEIVATKLATQIYRSFRRNELKYDVELKMRVIIDQYSFQIRIWKTSKDVVESIQRARVVNPDKNTEVLDDIYAHCRSMEYCNTALIKFYLLKGYSIIWWDNQSNGHGYNLKAALNSWDSTKQQ